MVIHEPVLPRLVDRTDPVRFQDLKPLQPRFIYYGSTVILYGRTDGSTVYFIRLNHRFNHLFYMIEPFIIFRFHKFFYIYLKKKSFFLFIIIIIIII